MTAARSPADPGPATRLVVWPAQDGLRLDQALAAATGLSRRRARQLVEGGRLRHNGDTTRVQSRPVAVGDVLEVQLEAATDATPSPLEPPPVTVLHHDPWLLAADKPAGVLSQPAATSAPGELALDQRLLLRLALAEGRRPFLRLVHRVDRLTSGVLLFARQAAALAPLAASWREGRVERLYLAVVDGWPQEDRLELDLPLGRDRGHAWRFCVDENGRPARTAVTVVARLAAGGQKTTLVECRLGSGRTHQVRVHLAAAGHPVVGDRLYGSRRPAPRPLLHAASLTLPHPRTGARLRLESPLPPDMAAVVGERVADRESP